MKFSTFPIHDLLCPSHLLWMCRSLPRVIIISGCSVVRDIVTPPTRQPIKNRFGPPKNDTSDQFVSVLWIWTWARGQHKTMMMSCWQITTCPTGCRYDIYGINRRLHMRACVHSWHGKEGVWMDILWLLLPTHKLMTIETWHTFTMDKLAGWSG